MILNALDISYQQQFTAHICIVGAGAVGIAMALELANTGLEVLLLEAGGTRPSRASQEYFKGTVADPRLHPPLEQHRARCLGGTTTLWSGRCVPYDPIDFEARDWVSQARWPISYDDLARFYPRANQLLEAGEFDYSSVGVFGEDQQPMIAGFNERAFTTDALERFSPPTNFAKRYCEELARAPNIKLLLHAAIRHIQLDEAGSYVKALDVRTPSGSRVPIDAEVTVLAMGGIEVTRLLLASRDRHTNGIGNISGVLGKFYMAHIAGTIGRFVPRSRDSVCNQYQVTKDGIYCRRRLALKPEVQRERRILNFVARLHHTRIADPSHRSGILSALQLGASAVPRRLRTRLEHDGMPTSDVVRHVANVVTDLPSVIRFARHMLVARHLADRKYPSVVVAPRSNVYSLDFHSEQEPNFQSQIRLLTETDRFGIPKVEADWRYTKLDLETVATSLSLFEQDVRTSGSGRFDVRPEEVEIEVRRYGAYGGHHLGTTRMGVSPRESIVDSDCKVHGVGNLYVASGSVLPTSGQANPTLTVVALGLRLAHHLRSKH